MTIKINFKLVILFIAIQLLSLFLAGRGESQSIHKCSFCHKTVKPVKGNAPLLNDSKDPSLICLDCHDYRENHHPIDFVPEKLFFVAPNREFPLFDNKISCLTCHAPHEGPDYSETPKLLRGGPYNDRREICFKCHFKEKYSEIDPHIMMDSKGKIIDVNGKPVCLICHSVKPDPAIDRTKDVRFRADVAFLCWRCHPPMPGEFFKYHFLVKPSRKVKEYIKKSEEELGIILPLVPRDRITCSTCHNPHQIEVIMHEPAKKGGNSPKRLRVEAGRICLACHYGK